MVLLTTSTYHRSPSSSSSTAAVTTRTSLYDPGSRRHVSTGKFQRITGHESYSPPQAASVTGRGGYSVASAGHTSSTTTRGHRSSVTPVRSSVTPGQAAAARSALYAASTTGDFLESEQYFRKMYPRYFSNTSTRNVDTRATSVEPSTYSSEYRSHRASSVTRAPPVDSRAHRATSVDNRVHRASSVSSYDGRHQRASSVNRAPPSERMTRASSVSRISSIQGMPRINRAISVSRVTSTAMTSLAPPISTYKSPQSRNDGEDLIRKARQIRASSLSRFHPEKDDDDDDANVYVRPTARMSRSVSMSRVNDYSNDDASKAIYVPRDNSTPNRTLDYTTTTTPVHRASSASRFSDREYETLAAPIKAYRGASAEYVIANSSHISSDIASYVLPPGQAFEPNDIEVSILPSGQRAVTYTQTSQTAQAGNDANRAIERIIERTQHMHTVADSLENFVRRWRHLFPADTLVVQYISYFRLKPHQLREAGERENAELYGMRLRERLIVPHGTDVRSLLRDFDSSQIDIEYRAVDDIRAAATHGLDVECENNRHENSTTAQRSRFVYKPHSRAPSVGDDYEVINYPRHRHTSVESIPRYERSYTSVTAPANRRCASVDSSAIRRSASPVRTKRRESYNYQTPRERRTSLDTDTPQRTRPRQTAAPSSRPERKQRDASPQFTSALCAKQCRQGQSVRLSCIVDSLDKVHVTWFKDKQEISNGGRFTISNKRGILSLEISDVVPYDAALYSVKANNDHGEAICHASLDVKESSPPTEVSDGTERPQFTSELANQCATLGGKLNLKVRARGRPKPSFTWQLNNRTIVEDSRTKLTSDERGNARLQISDVQPSDLGLYVCMASNKNGDVECSINVRTYDEAAASEPLVNGSTRELYDELPWETIPVKSFNYTHAAADKPQGTIPWFLQPIPSEISVHQGEPLTLQCVVDGVPKPVVLWYKGVRELQYGRRHRIVVENDHHMLQAVSTLQTDSGQYVVEAVNRVGKVQATCWVNLLPPRDVDDDDDSSIKRGRMKLPDFEHTTRPATEKLAIAPHFVKLLPFEKEIVEGATLEMECRVGDGESPVVEDGGTVQNGLDEVEVSGDVQNEPVDAVDIVLETSSEQLESVPVQEQGEGTEEPLQKQPEEGAEESVELILTQETETPVEASVNDEVEMAAESFILETSDDATVPITTVEAGSEDVEFSIDITTEETGGDGKIPEIVINGKAVAEEEEVIADMVEGELEVTPGDVRPVPEDIPPVLDAMEKAEEVSSVEQVPADIVTSEDVSAEVMTSVESAQVTDVESVKVELKAEDSITNETTTAEEFLIKEMSSADAQQTVTMVTSDGVGPAFIVALDSQKIRSGDVGKLVVTVSGKPEPQIKWQKDDMVLLEGGRIEMFADGDSFHLEISQLIAEDSGVYSCHAANDLGIASCSALLVVDEPALTGSGKLPEFKEPICDCVVNEGSDAQFDCRVTGDPTPEVKWIKGPRTLQASKKIATSFDGGVHLLVISDIHKSDEGDYECTAENSAGKITCSASLSIKAKKKVVDSSDDSSSDSSDSDSSSDSSSEDSSSSSA